MQIIETKVYTFDELSDSAKDKARQWYREGALDHEWWDCTYDDAKTIGLKITSFGLDRDRGAEGVFIADAEECAHKIEKEHGETCETFKTAKDYLAKRDACVNAAEKDSNGELIDERGLELDLDDLDTAFLASLLEDYAIILQKEYEYLLSDEAVDESIIANEYTFTEGGKRF
ncbi:hypothetical protein UFOVP1444_53 [uncultured Caudovirales phage]|uniref:Uncharacterized protein n=1 Tax=uncultured Caudovirales phage TaxID=2100421 RepID=A0A6J5SGB9_9CAUD|nr:hypothetical protein UFOVP1444_53 [uncultured Caudovirales phage]CAB5228039.1 hypothetical protein UFOVP1536_41 [uncultured Caudovirales phage]